ncbi:hypothetical protein GQX73_g10675 [Xylaria multiplex]|uniref:Uncharacterized protein n=1 Tax=Xylaria multiplex TaxID=323545 RepID=A0A7C8MF31_9PEZI|nr:hypothetical protein GQX73_g10675 [Xylaria multiplex]
MASKSTSQYPKGSAEYTATYLTTRGLGCSHPVKYHADGTQKHSKYPSRLGFFHVTSQEPRISFLDTRKLCSACLDAVVPDGFHFWSAYSIINGTSATESRAPEPRWLDMASSSDNYPPLVQAGTEGFPHVPLLSGLIPPHLISPPVVLSIPKVTGAKATWEWLQTRKQPFYIDQLHLTKGWSLIVERRAKIDTMIAEQSGTAYCPEAEPKTQDRKQNSSDKIKTSFEEETGSTTTTALRTKDKKKPSKDKHSPSLVTIKSTGSIVEPNVALDELENLSKLVEIHKPKDHSREEHIFSSLNIPPEDGKNTTTMESAEQPIKKTSSTSKVGKDAKKKDRITPISNLGLGDNTLSMIAPVQCMNLESITTPKPKLAETAIGMAPPRKTTQFTFTKNWSNHDPTPYDGPNVHLQLSDHRRQAQVTDHAGDPGSNFSSEKPMGKKQLTKGKISLSDPNSSNGTPDMTTLPRAAGTGELKIPMKASSTTKTKITKSNPITGDSSKKIKPSTEEFVGNKPVEVKPRKKAGSSGERIGESGPRQKELTKPPKTRTPEHGRAVGKPIKNRPLPDLRSGPKPATVTYPSTKFRDSKLRRPMEKSSSGKKFSIGFDADFSFDLHLGKSSSKDSKKRPDNHGVSGAASFVQSRPLPNSSTPLAPTEESMTGPPDQKPLQVEGFSGGGSTENPTDSQASIIIPLELPPSHVETSPGDAEIINAGRTQGPGAAVPTPVTGEPQGVIPSPGEAQSTNIGHAHSPDAAATMSSVGESQKVGASPGDTQITNVGHTQWQSINIVNFSSGRWGGDEASGDLNYESEFSAELYGTNDNSDGEDDSNDNNSNSENEDNDSDQGDSNSNQEDRDSEESEREDNESEKDESEVENDGDSDGDENEDGSNSEKEDSESEKEDSESEKGDSESEKENSESEKEDSESEGEESESEGEDSSHSEEEEENNDDDESEKEDSESEGEDNSQSEEEENNDDDECDSISDDEDD